MSADRWSDCSRCGKHEFREDWEIILDDGVFEIWYYGSCQSCKFKHEFQHKENLDVT